jgi:hypothetical protein
MLSQGRSKLLEARRAVAAWAFAHNARAGEVQSKQVADLPRTTPVISAPQVHQTIWPPLSSPPLSPETSTFTYANGTFSVSARRPGARFRTHLRAVTLRQAA